MHADTWEMGTRVEWEGGGLDVVFSTKVDGASPQTYTGTGDAFGKVFKALGMKVGPERDLTETGSRNTLSHMKTNTLTIRIDEDLDRLLTKAAKQSGKNRSEIAREALRRQLRVGQFEALRKRIMPFAEARGYLTDEDVFRDIS